MTTMRLRWAAAAAGLAGLLAAGLAACGGPAPVSSAPSDSNPIGDIPDSQAFVTYSGLPGFTIKVPEGWATTTDADGSTVLTDKLNSIRLRESHTATAPNEDSARTDLADLKTHAHGFAGGAVSTVSRPAGPVILTTYRSDAPADPVTGKIINDDVERYQFFHQGLLVTVTLAGPHGADNVDPWRIVTDSVAFT
ncbi:hypothetical protein HDA40_002005 [Hamadaea flava]|uniref:Lipoprotein LpqN n=1 Tax=Hamadaea flava TaxID=1742688 RepID=A0ABV8LZX5_9ACTN|nr:hypothetical protein [Hamadaea flava]MCP2323498.1 hypothetical protein [Hamadaea flava]